LGAETAAHLGHETGLAELVGGADEVASFRPGQRARDVVVEGAGLGAGRSRALDAAERLEAGHVLVQRKGDFVPVENALSRVLLRKGLGWNLESLFTIERGSGKR
jgi:hypothetical protein